MTLQSEAIKTWISRWNNFHAQLSTISSSDDGHSSPISIISSSSSKCPGLPVDLLPDFESLSSCWDRLNFVRRFWNQTLTWKGVEIIIWISCGIILRSNLIIAIFIFTTFSPLCCTFYAIVENKWFVGMQKVVSNFFFFLELNWNFNHPTKGMHVDFVIWNLCFARIARWITGSSTDGVCYYCHWRERNVNYFEFFVDFQQFLVLNIKILKIFWTFTSGSKTRKSQLRLKKKFQIIFL